MKTHVTIIPVDGFCRIDGETFFDSDKFNLSDFPFHALQWHDGKGHIEERETMANIPLEGPTGYTYGGYIELAIQKSEDIKKEQAEYQPTEEELAAAELAQVKTEANAVLAAKSRANLVQTMSFTASEFSLLAKAELFPVWTVGETYPQGRRIQHEGIVYEVVSSGGVTAQEHQPPNAEGMLAVYRTLSTDPETGTTPTGTQDDPIPYLDGMDVEEGKYYSYNDTLYLANANLPACVWPPDTEGLWQWEEVTEA